MIEGTIVKVLKYISGGLPINTIGTVVEPRYPTDGHWISVAVDYAVEGHAPGYKFLLRPDELEIIDEFEGEEAEPYLVSNEEIIELSDTTITHGHPRFNTIVDQIKVLHSEKNFDYARGGDPLGNFIRVGEQLGMSASEVAHAYMLKQVDAVSWGYRQGGEAKVESSYDKLQDIAVYAVLQMILIEEEEKEEIGNVDDFGL